MLVGFALCGFVVIAPWLHERRFLFMLSGLVGLLLTSTVSLGFYVLLGMPMAVAIVASAILCALASCAAMWRLRPSLPGNDLIVGLLALLLVSAFVTTTCCFATISNGGPSVVCLDGSDQLGYAHIADWLLKHRVVDAPRNDPSFPYESWPAVLFWMDPRAGAFSYIANVAHWSSLSGLFSFDRACAIALASAGLGVPALFTTRLSTYFLLMTALVFSHWFDYSRDGYLAKLLSFPSYLITTGLFLITISTGWTPLRLFTMAVLVVAVALSMNGILSSVWLFWTGAIVLVGRLLAQQQTLEELRVSFLWLCLLCMVSVVTTGTLARPYAFVSAFEHLMPFGWNRVLLINLELENHGLMLSRLPEYVLWALAATSGLVLVFAIVTVIKQRLLDSMGLLSVPVVVPVVLRILNAKWLLYSCTGIFYPFALCGIAAAADRKDHKLNWLLLGCLAILMLTHLPRLAGAVDRYASLQTPKQYQFAKKDIDAIAEISDKEQILVDIPVVQPGLVLLVELLRDGHELSWTPTAYKTILGYRQWAQPKSQIKPTVKIVLPDSKASQEFVTFECGQFRVLRIQ